MRNFAYQVKEQVFDSKSMLDELNFYHQNHGKVSELTKKLTYIMGDYNKNYPISMMTLGNLGTPGAFSATTFSAAFLAMRSQTSVDGLDPLNIAPKFLKNGKVIIL